MSGGDHFAANEDLALNVASAGVLANDTDADGDSLRAIRFDASSALGASIAGNEDGSFVYDASALAAVQSLAAGQSLEDSFQYDVTDARPDGEAPLTVHYGIELIPTPSSVLEGNAETTSDDHLFLVVEQQNAILAEDLGVSTLASAGDVFATSADGTSTTLPAGTQLNSYLLHGDRTLGGLGQTATSVTFDSEIVALIWGNNTLADSDLVLGNAETAYPGAIQGRSGLEDNDDIEISADGRTLNYWSQNGPGVLDNLRVLTAPVTNSTVTGDVTITVNGVNDSPTVSSNVNAVTADEGHAAVVTGLFDDVDTGDVVSLSASTGSIAPTDTPGEWRWSYTPADGPGTTSVVITATDQLEAKSTTTFDLTVHNVAPTVTVPSWYDVVTVQEGRSGGVSGNWNDPGDDTVTISASVGDVVVNENGTWVWTYRTVDGPDETQTVTLTATDSDGDSSQATFELIVENRTPVLLAWSDTVTVNPGDTASTGGHLYESGDDTVSLTASIGTLTTSVFNDSRTDWFWTLDTSAVPVQSQTVTVTATDSDGASFSTTFDLIVTNLAPVLSNDGDVAVGEGEIATQTGSWSDPEGDSVVLTTSSGNVIQNENGSWNWSFPASDGPSESQTVTITATDAHGASTITSFALTVNNLNPTAIDDVFSVPEDAVEVSLGVLVNDADPAGQNDPLVITSASAPVGKGGTSLSPDQQNIFYSPAGDFEYLALNAAETVAIAYFIGDGDGGTASGVATVTVHGTNDAPTVAHPVDHVVVVDGVDRATTIDLSTVFDDVDDGAVLTWVVAGSDESLVTTTLEGSVLTLSYNRRQCGDATVEVIATDEHGASATSTIAVTILPPALSVSLDAVTGTLSIGGTACDDSVEVSIDDVSDTLTVTDLRRAAHNMDSTFDFSSNEVATISFFGQAGDDYFENLTTVASVVSGNAGNDTLIGGDGDDSINGGGDEDVLSGGGGADTLTGGTGDDNLAGNAGNDSLVGSGGNDSLAGGLDDDTLIGGSGNDSLVGGLGHDTLDGSRDDDTLEGSDGNDLLRGSGGFDVLFGEDGNDTLEGGADDDTLYGAQGADSLRGDSGNDELNGDEGADTLSGGNHDDTLNSGDGDDSLLGDSGHDRLLGQAGNDTISGGRGNDTLVGGADTDVLQGDSGNDSLQGNGGRDTLSGGENNDTLEGAEGNDLLNGDGGADLLQGQVGDDTLHGGDANDTLDGGEGDDSLLGEAGSDLLIGSDGDDVLSGGSENDTLQGSFGADLLTGDAGNDRLIGNEDNDTALGGDGRDTLVGGDGDDSLSGGDGNDQVQGSDGNDVLEGDAGVDTLAGNGGDDTVSGGRDRDMLFGGGGHDLLEGDEGDDRLFGEDNSDTLAGGTGNDTLQGGNGSDLLSGDDDDDSLAGGNGYDTLDGGQGHDRLSGGSENDQLFGGGGTDLLDGSDGDDLLDGGQGDDTLRGGDGADSLDGQDGEDRIEGGGGRDTLNGGADNDLLGGGDDDDSLTGGEGDDRLRGEDGYDTLQGDSGRDTLDGGDGDDSLIGGDGDDALQGADGDDTLDGSDGDDSAVGGDGNDLLSGGSGDDSLRGQNGSDTLEGGEGDDVVKGEGGADSLKGDTGNDELIGSRGNDTLKGGSGADSLLGDAGNDRLFGGADTDSLRGGSGDDSLEGGDDEDSLWGDSGDDTLRGNAGQDSEYGGSGNDELHGGLGADYLQGDSGDDIVDGGSGDDSLYGNGGVDDVWSDNRDSIADPGKNRLDQVNGQIAATPEEDGTFTLIADDTTLLIGGADGVFTFVTDSEWTFDSGTNEIATDGKVSLSIPGLTKDDAATEMTIWNNGLSLEVTGSSVAPDEEFAELANDSVLTFDPANTLLESIPGLEDLSNLIDLSSVSLTLGIGSAVKDLINSGQGNSSFPERTQPFLDNQAYFYAVNSEGALVLDPTDPFVYLSGNVFIDGVDISVDVDSPLSIPVSLISLLEFDPDAPIEIGQSGSPDPAIAISLSQRIPFTAQQDNLIGKPNQEWGGGVYVELSDIEFKKVELDGAITVQLDADGNGRFGDFASGELTQILEGVLDDVRLGINGNVSLNPSLPGKVKVAGEDLALDLALGTGSLIYDGQANSGDDNLIYFAGESVDLDTGERTNPLSGTPFDEFKFLNNATGLEVAGIIDLNDIENLRVKATGTFNGGEAKLDIDGTRAELSGKQSLLGATIKFDGVVDLKDKSVDVTGSFQVDESKSVDFVGVATTSLKVKGKVIGKFSGNFGGSLTLKVTVDNLKFTADAKGTAFGQEVTLVSLSVTVNGSGTFKSDGSVSIGVSVNGKFKILGVINESLGNSSLSLKLSKDKLKVDLPKLDEISFNI